MNVQEEFYRVTISDADNVEDIEESSAYIYGKHNAIELLNFLTGLAKSGSDLSNIEVYSPFSHTITTYKAIEVNGIIEVDEVKEIKLGKQIPDEAWNECDASEIDLY